MRQPTMPSASLRDHAHGPGARPGRPQSALQRRGLHPELDGGSSSPSLSVSTPPLAMRSSRANPWWPRSPTGTGTSCSPTFPTGRTSPSSSRSANGERDHSPQDCRLHDDLRRQNHIAQEPDRRRLREHPEHRGVRRARPTRSNASSHASAWTKPSSRAIAPGPGCMSSREEVGKGATRRRQVPSSPISLWTARATS